MKPEQVIEFKKELSPLLTVMSRDDLAARVEALLRKYDLPTTRENLVKRKKRCQTIPVSLAHTSSTGYVVGGVRYTGGVAYVPSGSSVTLGWCPTLNALLLKREWWTGEDSYLRIRETSKSSARVLSQADLTDFLLREGESLSIFWAWDEKAELRD